MPNPFVSGGLLTDFVSSAAAGKEVKEGRVNGRNDDTAREVFDLRNSCSIE